MGDHETGAAQRDLHGDIESLDIGSS